MNSNRIFFQATVAVVVALGCSFANATPIDNSKVGLTDAGVVIGFDEHTVANNDPVTTQFADKGVAIDPFLYYSPYDQDQPAYAGVIDGNFVGNYSDTSDGPQVATFTLMFSTLQTRAAFGFASNDGAYSFEAFLGTNSVERFVDNDVTFGYFGFTGTSGFDRIVVTSLDADFRYVDVDNIQFDAAPVTTDPSVVPEPDAAALLGLGLLGALSVRRRSRKAA